MRTTVNLPPDIEAEVDRLRREEGLGRGDAVVFLPRRGLSKRPPARRFTQRTARLGARVDVGNIGEVLDLLDES